MLTFPECPPTRLRRDNRLTKALRPYRSTCAVETPARQPPGRRRYHARAKPQATAAKARVTTAEPATASADGNHAPGLAVSKITPNGNNTDPASKIGRASGRERV